MRYLTFDDLRLKLGGRGRSTIYRDIEFGRLPKPIRLGGRNYWPEAEVEAALDALGELRSRSLARGRT
jgi:predicted DNA-binding transcriptional regulator AlpA